MGTIVTIEVVRDGTDDAITRAFGWFREIESRCTRFNDDSELVQLSHTAGRAVAVSPIVFEAVRFAVAVAADTDGAFDPTVQSIGAGGASYRDIAIDADARTIRLNRPLALDLGAIAKGLAVDSAARELAPYRDFVIDAGGDLYVSGRNARGERWRVGVRHPRVDGGIIDVLHVTDTAVCTSGDYERGPHLIDPTTREAAAAVASVTVLADTAMLADALGTAAFVLGAERGIALLERHLLEGLILTPDLARFETRGWPGS